MVSQQNCDGQLLGLVACHRTDEGFRNILHRCRERLPSKPLVHETRNHLRPIPTLPTFIFIDEIVRQNKGLQDTQLYSRRCPVSGFDGNIASMAKRVVDNWPLKPSLRDTMSAAWRLQRASSRRGKHRLAVAQALGLECVPGLVHFISGQCLLKFTRKRDLFWPGRLLAAIRETVEHAVTAAEDLQDFVQVGPAQANFFIAS